jgi:hypothetical protein
LPHLCLFHIEHIGRPEFECILPEHPGLKTYLLTAIEIFYGLQISEGTANTDSHNSARTADPDLHE